MMKNEKKFKKRKRYNANCARDYGGTKQLVPRYGIKKMKRDKKIEKRDDFEYNIRGNIKLLKYQKGVVFK